MIPLAQMFTLVGQTVAELTFTVTPTAAGAVDAAGQLTLAYDATGTVTVQAAATGVTPATFTITTVTPKP